MSDEYRRKRGQHANPIERLIMSCGVNQMALLDMLQNYVESQCAISYENGKSATVESVCMSLHSGPPRMECGACAEAERTVPAMMMVQSEIEAARERKD
jgi:hypothetical protein